MEMKNAMRSSRRRGGVGGIGGEEGDLAEEELVGCHIVLLDLPGGPPRERFRVCASSRTQCTEVCEEGEGRRGRWGSAVPVRSQSPTWCGPSCAPLQRWRLSFHRACTEDGWGQNVRQNAP